MRPRDDLDEALAVLHGYLSQRPVRASLAVRAIRAGQRVREWVRLAAGGRALGRRAEWVLRRPAAPVLAVVPPNWAGVTTSALNNFPNVLLLPDQAPNAQRTAQEIARRGLAAVVFSDVPEGLARVAQALKASSPQVRILVHYQGSFAQNSQTKIRLNFRRVVTLARDGVLERVGCAKAGMAEALEAMGVRACYVPNRVEPPARAVHHAARSPRKVGVFVEDVLRKNANTQFAAACMLKDAEVHVNEAPDPSYLPAAGRLAAHGRLPYDQFLLLLGEMDLNLYVSLSECYPMTVVESLIRGVPCLTSHTHEIFAHDAELGRALIVAALDNPVAITQQAELVLADREAIGRRCEAFALELNRHAEAALNEFVGFEIHGSDGRPPG